MKPFALKSPIHLNKCLSIGTSLFLGLLILNELLFSFPVISFIILFFTGWLFWTFVEYFIHRFLMHELILPGSKDTLFNHQKHHQQPHDLKVRPFHRLIFLLILVLAIWFSVNKGGYTPILSGFLFGFTTYNYIHYILHQPFGKHLLPNVQRAHILHHFNRPQYGYSFSTSFWDWLFRTQPPKEDKLTETMIKNYFLNKSNLSKTKTSNSIEKVARKFNWIFAFLILSIIPACSPVFSDLQSARTPGKGQIEYTPITQTQVKPVNTKELIM